MRKWAESEGCREASHEDERRHEEKKPLERKPPKPPIGCTNIELHGVPYVRGERLKPPTGCRARIV